MAEENLSKLVNHWWLTKFYHPDFKNVSWNNIIWSKQTYRNLSNFTSQKLLMIYSPMFSSAEIRAIQYPCVKVWTNSCSKWYICKIYANLHAYFPYFKAIYYYNIIMLIFCGEKHLRFSWIALQPQKLFGKILHMNTMTACKSW